VSTNNNPRFFYGYVVIIASFFIGLLVWGTYNSFGVFFEPICSEFGWSRTMVSGLSSLTFFLVGLFSILTGKLTDRFGPRRLVMIYGLILGLGYFLMSRVNSVWELYLCYGLAIGLGTSCADASLLPTAARWFVKNRGIMSGMVKVGTGAGILIMPLVSTWLILSHDWRYAYSVLAIVIPIGLFAGALFLRRDPAEKGLQPYGVSEEDSQDPKVYSSYTLQQALRSKQLWTACSIYFIVWYCTQTIMIHIVPHAIDLEMSAASAAGMLSAIGASSIAGRLVIGRAIDKIGSQRALTVSLCILAASFAWLLFARQAWMLYLFVPIYGFAHGAFFALMSPLIAELFGIGSHGSIFGVLLFVGQSGGAVGPIIAGRIFDVTKDYQIAFIILMAASIVGLILSLTLKPAAVRQRGI
jgi:MFS family permease